MSPRHKDGNTKIPKQNLVPYTFIFSPVGIGKKEKREQWVWKDEVKGSKKPQPIAYDCVIRGGPVPTITIRRPIDPTKGAPAQSQLSCRTNPPVLERYSSPTIPGYHQQRPPSPKSATTTTTTTTTTILSKREYSPLSIEYNRPNFEKVQRKPLPSLPNVKSNSLDSSTFDLLIERSFMDGSESSETGMSAGTFIEPPQ